MAVVRGVLEIIPDPGQVQSGATVGLTVRISATGLRLGAAVAHVILPPHAFSNVELTGPPASDVCTGVLHRYSDDVNGIMTLALGATPGGAPSTFDLSIRAAVVAPPGAVVPIVGDLLEAVTVDGIPLPPSRTSSVVWVAPAPLRVATTELPGGFTDEPYHATMLAAGGVAPYHWTATLPPTLAMSDSGVLSGNPGEALEGSVVVTVRDSAAPAQVATATLPLAIREPEPVVTAPGIAVTLAEIPIDGVTRIAVGRDLLVAEYDVDVSVQVSEKFDLVSVLTEGVANWLRGRTSGAAQVLRASILLDGAFLARAFIRPDGSTEVSRDPDYEPSPPPDGNASGSSSRLLDVPSGLERPKWWDDVEMIDAEALHGRFRWALPVRLTPGAHRLGIRWEGQAGKTALKYLDGLAARQLSVRAQLTPRNPEGWARFTSPSTHSVDTDIGVNRARTIAVAGSDLDILVARESSLEMLAGRGDGTFDAARPFGGPIGNEAVIRVAPLDAIGRSSVVVGTSRFIISYANRGLGGFAHRIFECVRPGGEPIQSLAVSAPAADGWAALGAGTREAVLAVGGVAAFVGPPSEYPFIRRFPVTSPIVPDPVVGVDFESLSLAAACGATSRVATLDLREAATIAGEVPAVSLEWLAPADTVEVEAGARGVAVAHGASADAAPRLGVILDATRRLMTWRGPLPWHAPAEVVLPFRPGQLVPIDAPGGPAFLVTPVRAGAAVLVTYPDTGPVVRGLPLGHQVTLAATLRDVAVLYAPGAGRVLVARLSPTAGS